jgi:tRNA nucleotidyltransferase (CCA-adding enzyme)
LDFYGGQRDLSDKTIRVLHSLSLVEDPTRVFRAVRFEQRFGFRLGKETLSLIKGAVTMDLFHRLSGTRLLEELVLLFSEDDPRRTIRRLGELGLLRFIHPALKPSSRLETLLKSVEQVLDWSKLACLNWPGPPAIGKDQFWAVYLMALMEMVPVKAVSETLKRLAVPERVAVKIRAGHGAAGRLVRRLARRPPARPAEIYRSLHGLSDETLLLLMAATRSEAVKREVTAYFTHYRYVRPALSGRDLQTMGLKPGPLFKRILDRLLDARLNGEVRSEAEERDLVRQIAGS